MSYDEADMARQHYGTTLAEAAEQEPEMSVCEKMELEIYELQAQVAKLKREHKMLVDCLEEARDDVEKGQMPSYAYMQRTLAAWGAA